MGSFGVKEWIIVLAIVLILFGAPKLPELARSLGKSMRILKEETKSLTSDDSTGDSAAKGGDASDAEASDK